MTTEIQRNTALALSVADEFIAEEAVNPRRVYALNGQNFKIVGEMIGRLGLSLSTLQSYRRGRDAALAKGLLSLLPVEEALQQPRGSVAQRLYQVGEAQSSHYSKTQEREDEKTKAAGLREVLNAAFSKLRTQAQKEAQEESEQIVVYVESGPLTGKINHSATEAARKAAIARRKP